MSGKFSESLFVMTFCGAFSVLFAMLAATCWPMGQFVTFAFCAAMSAIVAGFAFVLVFDIFRG